MKQLYQSYCNMAIRALLSANKNLMEASVGEAIGNTPYGKSAELVKDTIALDAIPEIVITKVIQRFDPSLVIVTEELGERGFRDLIIPSDIKQQPPILFSDPTDRSSQLRDFIKQMAKGDNSRSIREVISDPNSHADWEEMNGQPDSITGATSSITCVRQGKVMFTVILNYITQQIFLFSSDGCYAVDLSDKVIPENLTAERIPKIGQVISFPSLVGENYPYDTYKTFTTFLGKEGYLENFQDSMKFLDDIKHRHYDRPGGPSRTLYLSNLQLACNVTLGFILANGEKITEWIHWLSAVRFAIEKGQRTLRLFEVWHPRPWTKNGVLMSTSPPYSLFRQGSDGFFYLDMRQLKNFDNPSIFRSTLIVAPEGNEWIEQTVHKQCYREIILPPVSLI